VAPAWDAALFRAVHHGLHQAALDPFMKALSDPGPWKLPLLGLAAVLLLSRGRRGIGLLLACVLTVTASDQVTSRALKPLFARHRPSVELADTQPLFGVRRTWSFPSNHAVNFFSAGPLVLEAFPRFGGWYFVAAGAVALSRVYVGDHYPSDVVAGAVLGLCIGWLGRKALRRTIATLRRVRGDPSAGP
jgi:undecaprenyl-diphosphatase